MADLMAVCKAGLSGCCAVVLLFFGIVLAFLGLTLLLVGSMSTGADNDDVYDDQNRELQAAGGVMLGVGLIMTFVAIFLCCYACKKVNERSTGSQGTVLSTNPSQTAAVVTTYSAVPTSGQNYPPQNSYPQHPGYPQQNAYPQQNPPQNSYPAPPRYQPQAKYAVSPDQYPPVQHQHLQQASASNDNLPYNPNYPPAHYQANAPYPTSDRDTSAPSAPPISKMSFRR